MWDRGVLEGHWVPCSLTGVAQPANGRNGHDAIIIRIARYSKEHGDEAKGPTRSYILIYSGRLRDPARGDC